jgi:hypothetical protein
MKGLAIEKLKTVLYGPTKNFSLFYLNIDNGPGRCALWIYMYWVANRVLPTTENAAYGAVGRSEDGWTLVSLVKAAGLGKAPFYGFMKWLNHLWIKTPKIEWFFVFKHLSTSY